MVVVVILRVSVLARPGSGDRPTQSVTEVCSPTGGQEEGWGEECAHWSRMLFDRYWAKTPAQALARRKKMPERSHPMEVGGIPKPGLCRDNATFT